MSILVFQIFFKIYIYIYLNQIFFKNTYISNSKFWFYDRTNLIFLAFFFFFFWSKSVRISGQTQPKSWEEATSSKRACQKWRTSFLKNESRLHTVTESSERAQRIVGVSRSRSRQIQLFETRPQAFTVSFKPIYLYGMLGPRELGWKCTEG